MPYKNKSLNLKRCNYIGKKIILIECKDPHTNLKPGAIGIVSTIDDRGTIHVNWNDGSTLGLIPGIDKYHLVTV